MASRFPDKFQPIQDVCISMGGETYTTQRQADKDLSVVSQVFNSRVAKVTQMQIMLIHQQIPGLALLEQDDFCESDTRFDYLNYHKIGA